jgi:zinc transporter ZupT
VKIKTLLAGVAAGAMITVAATDLIPDSRRSGRPFLMTLMTALGFTFMTLLDVALG